MVLYTDRTTSFKFLPNSWIAGLDSCHMNRQFFASILSSHYSDVALVSIKALSALHTEPHIAKSSRAKSSSEEKRRRGEEMRDESVIAGARGTWQVSYLT